MARKHLDVFPKEKMAQVIRKEAHTVISQFISDLELFIEKQKL